MRVLLALLLIWPAASSSGDTTCHLEVKGTNGVALIQHQKTQQKLAANKARVKSYLMPRAFVGASPVASETLCAEDLYQASSVESTWQLNVLNWTETGDSHCSHLKAEDVEKWIGQNKDGKFDNRLFSTLCRNGKVPQFIEPLAGILRNPRFACNGRSSNEDLFSVDWLVFPDSKVLTQGAKARFFDAGGSYFSDALQFFLDTYKGHGIVFDEVYVWEFNKQGADGYWRGVDQATRDFWEPRVKFYDGIGVTAEKGAEHNPVSRIFKTCQPQDFCAFKLDIDTPTIETPLIQQLLETPAETKGKLDELFFEHHIKSVVMQPYWGNNVDGTFADSYKFFGDLRKLGVRAHSWV